MEKWHAAKPASIVNGAPGRRRSRAEDAGSPAPPQYTKVFGDALVAEAERDERVIGITAAMNSGTGLDILQKALPDRYYDVGIAEQHAVLFAAGLALQGAKPVAAIYSTFLQRGFDQIVHDVCLQNLDVVFAMDRAGLVGDDGPTHHGAFDISYLRCLPNMTLMAPRDEAQLVHMLHTALRTTTGPVGAALPARRGRGRAAAATSPRRSRSAAARCCARASASRLLGYGYGVPVALGAADLLAERARHRRHRGRRPLRQAARRRADRVAGGRARRARDGRGERAGRRLRLRGASSTWPTTTCSATRACCASACPTAT